MTEDVLVFLKPDALIRRYIGARVIKEFLDAGFKVKYFGEVRPSKEFIAKKHYAQHIGKLFYEWLIDYVTSSPLLIFILNAKDAIYKVRKLLGATISENADCDTIRGRYGIFGGINVAHASDNAENGRRELEIWEDIVKIEKEANNYMREASMYISKFIDFPMVDTIRYREISMEIVKEKIEKEEAKKLLMDLLRKESDFNIESIARFTEIIIRNALSRKGEISEK